MTATVDLTEQEIAELKGLTRESDPAAAVRVAMAEYLRYAKRMRLKELSGRLTMDENRPDLEGAEGESGGGPGAG
jgi:hypothetical protein